MEVSFHRYHHSSIGNELKYEYSFDIEHIGSHNTDTFSRLSDTYFIAHIYRRQAGIYRARSAA